MPLIEQKNTPPSLSIFVVALILTILSALFFTYPRYKAWQQNKAAIADQQAQLGSLEDQSSRVNSSLNKIKQNVTSLSLVNAAIPDSPNIPDLYAHLEQLVKGSNLILASVQAAETVESNIPAVADPNAAPVSPSPTLGVVDITMDVKGSISDFNGFLSALEKSLRFLEVQDITVSGSGNSSASNGSDVTFRLQIKTYYEK